MPPLITLIPNSGVQFVDVELDAERIPRQSRTFWEEPLGGAADPVTGGARVKLHELVMDAETDQLVDPLSREAPPEEETYPISARHALELHNGRWVPLPYFLLMSRSGAGAEVHDRGPTNWARMRLVPAAVPKPGLTHRLTIAFDTALLPRPVAADAPAPDAPMPYVAPAPEDSARSQEFVFVADPAANAWFINEAWVGNWLREMFVEMLTAARGGRPLRPEDLARGCEHYARYQVMLGMLAAADAMPRIRLLDTVSANRGDLPVAVDLVLDLGNARTCGILIEEHPGQGMNLSESYPLALRDLSRPEMLHALPFESRVEFARARFGRDAVSRQSGRASAFVWPSPVRVGPEAGRLAGARLGNEGSTGLSSPKRYLWDTRAATQGWRFNGRGDPVVMGSETRNDPPVSGPFMALLSEDGQVLRQRRGQPAVRARFSRSSVFTLMLAEILLQALGQMNAPGNRAERRDADKPRTLRTVLMTMPPGMPVAEQHILRARAQGAVLLAWDMLGWSGPDGNKVPPPRVLANLDEATATQIVWLHNEVTERLQGDVGALMELVGRVRGDPMDHLSDKPTLRVASIDIGGGTTDLTVSTYSLQAGDAIVPRQEFRESFKIAGDDVLERVIGAVVLPCFARSLRAAGVADPRALLNRALGQDQGGQSEPERHRRRLFVSLVMEPLGIAVLRAYEAVEGRAVGEVLHATVAALLSDELGKVGRVTDYLEQAAEAAGASGFTVADVLLEASTQQIEPVVAGVLGPVLADLCEVVWAYDCDVLLLSGRPSRLRVVGDMVLAKAPVPPHRIVGMHRYRVGDKYPFKDAANRIDDPKTTVAVGAALCVQAEGRLRNFMLRTGRLSMRSTARYIGRMDNNGQIRDENVLLSNLDLDGPPAQDVSFKVRFQTVTQLGFRQLPLQRWTATPLYVMEFANPDDAQRMELPLTVTVARREIDPDTPEAEMQRETFVIDEVVDASRATLRTGDVRLRLQTLDDQDGYWRDTGRLMIP